MNYFQSLLHVQIIFYIKSLIFSTEKISVSSTTQESKETKSQDTTPIATTSQRPSPQKTTFETISQVTTGLKTTTIPQGQYNESRI